MYVLNVGVKGLINTVWRRAQYLVICKSVNIPIGFLQLNEYLTKAIHSSHLVKAQCEEEWPRANVMPR